MKEIIIPKSIYSNMKDGEMLSILKVNGFNILKHIEVNIIIRDEIICKRYIQK